MIPIFRAKRINSGEYVEGQYLAYKGYPTIFNEYGLNGIEIDNSTLSIHFPDMLDSQGNKIFASLQEDGKGGDIVISIAYPFYGDAPEITNSSGKCEELNYKGLVLFSLNGCFIDLIRVSDRVRGTAVGDIIEDFNRYKVVGVQE